MSKIIEFLAYMAGFLLVPIILILIWGNWYLILGCVAILFVISLLKGFIPAPYKNNSSEGNSPDGIYNVFTHDANGDFTYKRYLIHKDPWSEK